ncbi:MAG: efflux transporter outer membrane subunit, partial [Proteobacteria bacterium]|nr:efflux transporter outer membrane subunit [Pseudomonadota bacterium]
VWGCSPYRSRLNEDMPTIPSAFQHQLEQSGQPADRWWTLFDDYQLNELMEEMFKNNLDLEAVCNRWRQFQAEYRITDSARKFKTTLSASAARERMTSFFGAETDNAFGLSAAASYEVDLWNKLKSGSKAALLEVFATEADIEALYVSLAAEVGNLYFQIIESKQQLRLLEQTIESFQQALELVEDKYLQGVVSALDMYQAQQNLADAFAQKPGLEQELAIREHALSILLGRYPQIDCGGEKQELPPAPPPVPVDLPATLLKQRPDIQAALLRFKASDALIEAAVADRFPSFNLSSAGGYTALEVSSLFQSDLLFWNLIGQITQPIIDGGKRKAEVERCKARYQELLSNYRSVVLRAFQEVEDALVKNQKREEEIKRLENLVEASVNVLEMSLYRYVQGLSDYLPVLMAQRNYYLSKRQLISSRRAVFSDRIELTRVLGGSWQQTVVNQRLEKMYNE